MKFGTLIVLVALCGASVLTEPAFAKSGSRSALVPVASAALDGARIRTRVEAKSRGRGELRIDVARAAEGLTLEAWFADASGAMTFGGDFVADTTPGEYRYRVRTAKGGTLPAGAATIAELAQRAAEIRTADGTVVATGALGTPRDRTPSAAPAPDTTTGSTDDPAGDDHGRNRGRNRGGR